MQIELFEPKLANSFRSFCDFSVLKPIGQGGLGRVDLCRHDPSGRLYAIKSIDLKASASALKVGTGAHAYKQ